MHLCSQSPHDTFLDIYGEFKRIYFTFRLFIYFWEGSALYVTTEIERNNKGSQVAVLRLKEKVHQILAKCFFHKAYVSVRRPMNKCILKQQLHVARTVMGKHIIPKLLVHAFLFPFSQLDFRLKYPSKSPLQLYPLVCSGLLTSDISIKSGDIAQKEEWNRCSGHVSKSLLKQRSLITTSQLF